ncbi:uncharacterized protein LOC131853827 [Achroia grisella]|uniref:uncharacterized protein LOC131853827 n=1 Tax=Achroia grisella TaxID=688607 RepID=UPI0027D26FC6|nr:uncharacterized protein LOC131853827 [Achroia grisella]
MKYNNNQSLLCIISYLTVISKAYDFMKSLNDNSICVIRPILDIQTSIILNFVDDDLSFTKCYQSEVLRTLIIFNDDKLSYSLDMATRKKLQLLLYNKPNIIILTDSITGKVFNNTIFEITLQAHWSSMHLIITNKNINCSQIELSGDIISIAERFLNDLWHRHLLVYAIIEFPLGCPQKYITFDGNKRPNGNLYNRTITVIEEKYIHETLKKSKNALTDGFPLKINIFRRIPTSISNCSKIYNYIKFDIDICNGLCGMDALIMHDFIKTFKFNVTFIGSRSMNKYGYVTSRGVSGSLGAVLRQEIDVSFNSRFISEYTDSGYDFLGYISSDSLCALIGFPDLVPLWQYPIIMYSFKKWMFLFFVLMVLGLLKWLFTRYFYRIIGEEVYRPQIYIIETVWSGTFGFFLIKKFRSSFVIALCLLCSLVLCAKYQSHINYMFTTSRRYEPINTLQELCDSNIPVYTSPQILTLLGSETIENTTNNVFTTILRRMKLFTPNSSFELRPQDIAMVRRRMDIALLILLNYTDKEGRPFLYVIDENFSDFYLSYIVKSGFLFTSQMQSFMMRMVEAGLPDKYYKWTRYTMHLADLTQNPSSEPRLYNKISLKEQRIPFALLLCGYILSTLSFLTEIWYSKQRKMPN